MARIIYPINGKTYTAEDVEIFNSPRTSGIYSVLDFDCSLSGNVLTIGKGLAWIKNGDFTGKCVAFTEPETLTLDSADSTKNRFDVVAIRYDASKTEPELVIIKGEPADIPFPPERKKETYLYELFLYAILRKTGEGSASFENLSDLRDNETFCGIMRDSVTSSVAPLYETLYDDETGMSLFDGQPIPVETDKYVSYVATVKNSDMIVEIPLYVFDGTSFGTKINGKRVISTSAGDETTFLITFECFSENISISDIFWSSDTGSGQAILTKLVGITKQPEGYVKVDSLYNPESHNAQSGEAVKQAIDEALEGFEGGGSAEIPENIETTDNKVTAINENSTDEQYPSAKAVYDFVGKNQGNGGNAENSAFQILPIGKNLLNRETNTVGYKLNEAGGLVSAASYEVTDFISITENTEYCFSKNNGATAYIPLLLYFDVKKEVIGSEKNKATYPITSPANAKFVRFTVQKADTQLQFEQGNKITEYEEFNGANLIDSNKINFVPKSITPKEVNFFSTKAGGKNLLDRTKSTIGYSFDNTGNLVSSAKNEVSDYIPVAYGDNIFVSGTPDTGYSRVYVALTMYDEFKNLLYIETYGANIPNPLSVPRNVKYVRYAYRKAGVDVQIERGTEATEYEEFIPVPCVKNEYLNLKQSNDMSFSFNPWCGKRLVVDGDSITHDQGNFDYWQFVAAEYNEMHIDTSDTATQYANGWKGVGGSRIANELGANDPMHSIVLRYQNLPDDADLVMIAAGTNDWAHHNIDLGDFDSTDNTTFNGALNELLPALKAKYPTIPVVMMTPIKRGTEHNKTNSKGLTLEQFVDAMIAKCRQYGVYCLDMYSNCPINPQIPVMKELLFNTNDDTHPNTEGHKVMGKTVAGFIRTLS